MDASRVSAIVAEDIGAGIYASHVKREHCGQQLSLAIADGIGSSA
jgi:hypothetical protein